MENSHVGVLFKFIFRLFWTFWKKLFRAAILYESVIVYASVKKNSTADVISGILRNFGNTQGKGVKFVGLKFIKEELYYRAQPRNFPKFSKHLG